MEKKERDLTLIEIGAMLKNKRLALGEEYRSREKFIARRSEELFGFEDWISVRHLHNIENGKNWISVEKLILLAAALEESPVELFREIVEIYQGKKDGIQMEENRM